jgi:alpha-N-arabinofuranosidase
MGHPEPFHLKYLGVGNEQWGEDYFARYRVFQAALKKKYPELQLVTSAGPGVDDNHWKLAWDQFRSGTPADIVDEHYYRPPQWFLENASRYDSVPRNGTKVFAGEFAAHDGRDRKASLRAATAEAAFMTGLVRNSDVVSMSSYAPLLAKAGAWQWAPDLIWFDNTRVYGTPSYHVQALFSRNRPDFVYPVTMSGPTIDLPPLPAASVATYGARALEPAPRSPLPAVFATAGCDARSKETVIFLVNPYPEARQVTVELRGVNEVVSAQATLLASESPDDENSFRFPMRVAPRHVEMAWNGATLSYDLPAFSVMVARAK